MLRELKLAGYQKLFFAKLLQFAASTRHDFDNANQQQQPVERVFQLDGADGV